MEPIETNEYLDNNPDVRVKYRESLIDHIRYVKIACDVLGVPPEQRDIHDDSKFTLHEFPFYARQFFGDKGDPQGFAYAWLHHIHHNPHHWNHWVFGGEYNPKGAGMMYNALPMPEIYVREMVADWHGAGRAYQGHWDISEWLNQNIGRMVLHDKTHAIMSDIMSEAGYNFEGAWGWHKLDRWVFQEIDR